MPQYFPSGGGSGGGAPTDGEFVVLAADATLTEERVLTGTTGHLTVTDGGAGSTVTLDVGDFILNSAINSLYAAYVAGNTGAL